MRRLWRTGSRRAPAQRLWHISWHPMEKGCQPFHSDTVAVGAEELRVFRCDWGWCVKRGDTPYRARTLLEAFEEALGYKLEHSVLRDTVAVMERALTAEHRRTRETVSAVVSGGDSRPGTLLG